MKWLSVILFLVMLIAQSGVPVFEQYCFKSDQLSVTVLPHNACDITDDDQSCCAADTGCSDDNKCCDSSFSFVQVDQILIPILIQELILDGSFNHTIIEQISTATKESHFQNPQKQVIYCDASIELSKYQRFLC